MLIFSVVLLCFTLWWEFCLLRLGSISYSSDQGLTSTNVIVLGITMFLVTWIGGKTLQFLFTLNVATCFSCYRSVFVFKIWVLNLYYVGHQKGKCCLKEKKSTLKLWCSFIWIFGLYMICLLELCVRGSNRLSLMHNRLFSNQAIPSLLHGCFGPVFASWPVVTYKFSSVAWKLLLLDSLSWWII